MLNLTPDVIELLDWYEDGKDTRHYSFRLVNPEGMVSAKPGQFFMLCVPGAGEAPFTFTQLPDDQGLFRGLIKKVGSVTSALFSCERGSKLGIRGPFGKGWPLAEFQGKRVLIMAGGCGLAPLVSLIDSLLELDKCQQLVLVYGATDSQSQLLNPERNRWCSQMAVFEVLEYSQHESVLTGTPVDMIEHVMDELDQLPDVLLLCGPEKMMNRGAHVLMEKGLSPSSIWLSIERRMHCAVGLCGHCYINNEYVCRDGPTYRWDKLQALKKQG